MGLISELKRRNVLRMVVLYFIAAWLIMQVAEVMMSLAGLPAWAGRTTLIVLAVGFPIAVAFSWFYELTPEGVKLEKDIDSTESITHITRRRLDFIVISLLCAAVILFAYDKWWIGGPPEHSIAVLPFANMSGDPDQEYFSDGISEELLNLLAQMPGLQVAARTSSFQFKDRNEDVAKIADALNVAHVLEGSVRKSGNQVRITAQLIHADDGYHLWSETFDRELDDIFAVQEEIARAISDALKVKLALDQTVGEAVQPTIIKAANTAAYEAYLRGRQLIHLRGRENLENAVSHLERSLRLDNNFAPAHAQLAIATTLLMASPKSYGTLSLEEVRRKAIPHLERALELEPHLAEAHGGLALLTKNSGDPTSAIEYARTALERNPSYSDAMNWLYLALSRLGRYEEADAALMQMLVIDPMTIVGRSNYANLLGGTGRVEEGHGIADNLLPQSLWVGYVRHAEMSLIYEANLDEGLSWGLKAHIEDPGNLFSNYFVVLGFNWIGEYDEARRISDVSGGLLGRCRRRALRRCHPGDAKKNATGFGE